MVHKSLTHLKLNHGNVGKIHQLDLLAPVYLALLQFYCDWLIEHEQKRPNKYQDLPETETPLSARWQRCCWQQACGTVESWYSNEKENPPQIKAVSIQANANVVKLEKSDSETFDFWLQIATLTPRKPVMVPIKLYKYASDTLKKYPDLCSGVKLERLPDQTWEATLVVEACNTKPKHTEVIGIDVGMIYLASTSEGKHYGEIFGRRHWTSQRPLRNRFPYERRAMSTIKVPHDLREALAGVSHEIWSHWMRYQKSCGKVDASSNFALPAEKVTRWERQMETPYQDLTVKEQSSDLEQADKILRVLCRPELLPALRLLVDILEKA